ncbi:MAG: 4'-phosphopantetheinyl transferase superfamily protein [Verrucomicrobiota bacterium]
MILEEFGKPILAPPHHWLHFNLSHCNDLAAIAICAYGPVGIDLESMNRAEGLLECETSFCHPEEIADLPGEASARAFQLLRIWTAKEAVLKALGTGLSHPPEEVRIRFGLPTSTAVSKTLLLGINDQRLHSLEDPALTEHQAVVSAPKSVMEIEILKGFLNHP